MAVLPIAVASRVVWSEAVSVGVREIDADYHRLVLLYDKLQRMMKSSRGGGMLHQALVDLDEYTRSHFAREEAWIRGFRYPGLAVHIREHAELAVQVHWLRQAEACAGTTLTAVQTLRLLGQWIRGHILQTDQRAAACLKTAEPYLGFHHRIPKGGCRRPADRNAEQKSHAMGSNEWGGRRLQSLSAERSVRSCGEHRVVWTAALSAGVGEIDRERQRLFAFHEAVHGVIRGRGDGGMLAGVLDQLVEYTRTHFAREEHWMRKCDYPGFDAHVHEHRHFTKQVRCLQQEQGAAPTMIEALKTLQLLSRWIPNHIERTDLALGEHLRAAGMGEI